MWRSRVVDSPSQIERQVAAVLAVLAGTSLDQVASLAGIAGIDLAAAVEAYQAAGRAALQARALTQDWYQVSLYFTDWDIAEHTAAIHLASPLAEAAQAGQIGMWWFIRKAPIWRLRCQVGPTATVADIECTLTPVLERLAAAGLIGRWQPTIYEPETLAFGGAVGIGVAHRLFHADSRHTLEYVRDHDTEPGTRAGPEVGRRELSVLLCSSLFRAAGQDWYEQGDIWHRVTQMRPLPPDTSAERLAGIARDLHRLMTLDTSPTGNLCRAGGPLTFANAWIEAFDHAGRALRRAARDGNLNRGTRDILAHYVIFHWNRLGLTARIQAILAHAARDTVMNPDVART
jgi:thiopeptide-type bacteriocin biosynthesis protein